MLPSHNPSAGLVMPIAEATEHCAHRHSRLPIYILATQKSAPSQDQMAYFMDPPFGGRTCHDTIPSVIKVSTQGSRVLDTRGTPTHTEDDIKGRNKWRKKSENRYGVIKLKKKEHS